MLSVRMLELKLTGGPVGLGIGMIMFKYPYFGGGLANEWYDRFLASLGFDGRAAQSRGKSRMTGSKACQARAGSARLGCGQTKMDTAGRRNSEWSVGMARGVRCEW